MEAVAAVRLHTVRRGVGSLPRSRSIRLTRMSTTPPLDSLMTRVARGDAEAFSELYDQTSSMVYGLALRVVRSEAMAEEVTQEVFLQVWRMGRRPMSPRWRSLATSDIGCVRPSAH